MGHIQIQTCSTFKLLEKTQDETFLSDITEEKVFKAKEIINSNGYSTAAFFLIIASLNFLNTAIKRTAFKKHLTYSAIKGNVSRIGNYFASLPEHHYEIEFYINTREKCAYFEVYGLQFSFHDIHVNSILNDFIHSPKNAVKPWRGIRLQKIAGELFDLAIELMHLEHNTPPQLR